MASGNDPTGGWYPDPGGAYQYRWWDGTWSEYVAHDGTTFQAPLGVMSNGSAPAAAWSANSTGPVAGNRSAGSPEPAAGGYAAYRQTPAAHRHGGMALLILGVLVALFNLFLGGFLVLLGIASLVYATSLNEPQAQSAGPATRPVEQRLHELDRLHRNGQIDDTEYEAQRARIVGDI